MNSRTRRTCYPRGSLSVRNSPHLKGHVCSLSPTFVPASHFVKDTVSPTFVFDPLRRGSDAPELNIGRLCFLIEGVPPQSNHPSTAVPGLRQVRNSIEKEQCYTFAYPHPRRCGVTAPAYAGHPQSNHNSRLWLSSTGSSFWVKEKKEAKSFQLCSFLADRLFRSATIKNWQQILSLFGSFFSLNSP